MKGLQIERLKGAQIEPYLQDLGNLRIQIFREYPYLYEGDRVYEQNYLKTYLHGSEKTLLIVKDHNQVVGASTALPLEFETVACQKPFIDNHYDLSKVFYFGESVLLPEYRGRGIYKYFFEEREAAAKAYGSQFVAFCTVLRDEDDPRRPRHYVPLDPIWRRFGYQIQPHLKTYYEWKEIGHSESTLKPMIFWMKEL